MTGHLAVMTFRHAFLAYGAEIGGGGAEEFAGLELPDEWAGDVSAFYGGVAAVAPGDVGAFEGVAFAVGAGPVLDCDAADGGGAGEGEVGEEREELHCDPRIRETEV